MRNLFSNIRTSVISGLFIFGAASAAKAQDSVTIAADDFAPYAWKDSDGNLTGIDIDIMRHAAARVGVAVDIDLLPFKRLLHHAQTGKSDFVMSLFKTEQRETFAIFSQNPVHLSSYSVYASPKRALNYKGIHSLVDKTIAMNLGFTISEELEERVNNGEIDVLRAESNTSLIRMLGSLSVDAIIANELTIDFASARSAIPVRRMQPAIVKDRPAYMVRSRKGASKFLPYIHEQLDMALGKAIEEGVYRELVIRYSH